MIALLHVFAIGLQHPRIGSRLREHFAEHSQVQAHGCPQAQPFGEACCVNVHHHVHQGLDLCGGARGPNVAPRSRQLGQDRLGALACALLACRHQIQCPLASLSNAGRHAGFHTLSAHSLRPGFHHHMGGGTHGRTVNEQFSCSPFEQAVAFLSKQRLHRVIVRDHCQDHVGQCGHRGQSRRCFAPEFLGQRLGLLPAKVIDCAYMEP